MRSISAKARLIALTALLGLAPTSASAEPTKANTDEAQRRFQHGRDLYDDNDFQGALVEFQRAYELAQNYKLLYNIAQVQYQLQDYPGALRTFTRYLAEGKGDINAQRREEVQKEIDRLRSRVASVRITVNEPGAEILVDDVSVGKAPLSEPVMVSVGHRKISATLRGHAPVSRFVDVAGMDSIAVKLELFAGATAAPPPGDTPQKPRGFPIVAWGITGGLGVAAAITGGIALGASSSLTTKLETLGSSRADLDAAGSKTKALALTTDVVLGATVVAAGVSLYLTLSGGSEKPVRKAAARSPIRFDAGPRGVGIMGAF